MPTLDQSPKNLRPYLHHGLDLDWSEGSEQATGESIPIQNSIMERSDAEDKETSQIRGSILEEGR